MNKSFDKKSSLLLCATPLHVLIVEKIIEKNPDSNFDLIFMISENDNSQKFLYYYNRIKGKCRKVMLWKYRPKSTNLIKFKAYLFFKGFSQKYSRIYLANIQRVHFQLLVSSNLNSDIFTFDDGLGNILPSSDFHTDNPPNFIRRAAWSFLGIKVNSKDIKHLSEAHYTIYKDLPNISSKTRLLKLHGDQDSSWHPNTHTIKIYLGQPLYELDEKFSPQYISQVLTKLNITQYFPHPRERNALPSNIKVIHSKYIFEDYVLKLIDENPDSNIEVYSFFSSAIMNIASIKRVKCYYIFDSYIAKRYKDIYLLADSFPNINLIKV